MTDSNRELWTADQTAEHLGIQPGSVRRTLSRWCIRAATYRPHPDSGRPQALYPADAIRAAQAAAPGQGARTDRRGA